MRVLLLLVAIVASVICDDWDTYHANVQHKGRQMDTLVLGKNGGIKFFSSSVLGSVAGQEAVHFQSYIHSQGDLFGLQGTEEWKIKRAEKDIGGNQHVVLQQYNRGLIVEGGEVILHIDTDNQVFAVTSAVLADTVANTPKLSISHFTAIKRAVRTQTAIQNFQITEVPQLCYVIFNDEGFLAYKGLVEYVDVDNITKSSHIYVSAIDGSLILENPLWMTALNRAVYTANNKLTLPGTLQRSEGQSASSDKAVNAAYDNSGVCYEYFKKTFNRDSIDNKGKKLVSTVHYDKNYNNAFWNNQQMVYGDGDGITFSNFAGDLSVVCHELTHAVTSYTANLRYQGESGALNEAMSDIFGAASTVFKAGGNGIHTNTWNIGHECYLKGIALRYMNNPKLDGVSYDWYPTRYTGTQDNGGVHWNSGIANLAFVLMVQGGVHPQGRSSQWVQEIGISHPQQIFYSALTQYLTATSTFAQARAATETAASKLYGATAAATVTNGWKAVGVN